MGVAHLATGTPPERGADGRLIPTEESGVVLVLLPGGECRLGAQSKDRDGPHYDPLAEEREGPVRTLSLPAFFISKYELTQGQWMRITGKNPSQWHAGRWDNRWRASRAPATGMHPVERISWLECLRAVRRAGLVLPTQAQWEYAARAGTDTPWFTGAEKETLQGAANLLDVYSKEHGGSRRPDYEQWMRDDASKHAPVGAYAPNAFGLHDVAGNVWEWCLDLTPPDAAPLKDALRLLEEGGSFDRAARGGSYFYGALHCRSTHSTGITSTLSVYDVGARPALELTD